MPRPEDTPLTQQRLPSWQPIMTPRVARASFAALGVPLLALGVALFVSSSEDAVELSVTYDGAGAAASAAACHISRANAGATCALTFEIEQDMAGEVYVYFALSNFYQNHRTYVNSYDQDQLMGDVISAGDASACWPLKRNGSRVLSPCGLIANTLFSDTFAVASGQTMRETDIAWASDVHKKYFQPSNFAWALASDADKAAAEADCSGLRACDASVCTAAGVGECSGGVCEGCRGYACTGGDFDAGKCEAGDFAIFYYPKESTVQYIYETFPQVISPLVGVKSEHFAVWMRTAAQSSFRKLYGRIPAGLKKGDTVTFNVTNNFEVDSFDGSKALVLSSPTWFDSKNPTLGIMCAFRSRARAADPVLEDDPASPARAAQVHVRRCAVHSHLPHPARRAATKNGRHAAHKVSARGARLREQHRVVVDS